MSVISFVKNIKKRGVIDSYRFLRGWWSLEGAPRVRQVMRLKRVPVTQYVEIEVTTHCNLKCIMCEHTYWDHKPKHMTFEQFKYIMDQFPKLSLVIPTGIGSSFLNPDYMKMLRYLKQRGSYIYLFDHFYLPINKKIITELVDMHVEDIHLSIDGATAETYNKIRVGSDFDTVINNIKTLVNYRNSRKQFYPRVHVQFVVMNINLHEMPQFVKLMDKLGVNTVEFCRILAMAKESKKYVITDPALERKMIAETKELAKKLKTKVLFYSFGEKLPPFYTCMWPWNGSYISVEGYVYPCCGIDESDVCERSNEIESFGNVFEEPFKDIWNNQKYVEFRSKILRKQLPSQCVRCSYYALK